MNRIPLSRPFMGIEEFKAVEDVLKSGWLTHGSKTTEFETIFADYLGVKYAIAMNSCTSALFLAILANQIKGEILVPSFTFVASANAIKVAGAKPVFIDINYHDCNVNPDLLENHVSSNTEALMVVHYAGQCCDMDKISTFVKRHDLMLIEDSAETIGGTFNGRKSGSWGIGCYSFFPTKNITTGEGGMLTTNNDELANRVRTLVNHGIEKSTYQREREKKNWYRVAIIPGFNFRLSNILAAIGVEQMKKLEKMNDLRRQHSIYLIEQLGDVEEVDLPYENENCEHVYQMFTIKVKEVDRDDLVLKLRKHGIEASVHFDPPVHLHPAYAGGSHYQLPVTEKMAKSILTLPMFPELTRSGLDHIAAVIKEYYGRR